MINNYNIEKLPPTIDPTVVSTLPINSNLPGPSMSITSNLICYF